MTNAILESVYFYQAYTSDDLGNWSTFNNNGTNESRTHNNVNEITASGSTNYNGKEKIIKAKKWNDNPAWNEYSGQL